MIMPSKLGGACDRAPLPGVRIRRVDTVLDPQIFRELRGYVCMNVRAPRRFEINRSLARCSSAEPRELGGRERFSDGRLFLESRVENRPIAMYAFSMAYVRPVGSTLTRLFGDQRRKHFDFNA
jgi:hypothetical protein